MNITIEEVEMLDAATQSRVVRPNLWRIRTDGRHAGFIERKGDGVPEDAVLLMHLTFPPEQLAEIEKAVSERFDREVGAVQPSGMPESKDSEPEDDILDDLE